MKVLLLTTDTLHHCFFVDRILTNNVSLVCVVEEKNQGHASAQAEDDGMIIPDFVFIISKLWTLWFQIWG